MEKEISIIDKKKRRLLHLILGGLLLILIPFYMVDNYENRSWFYWFYVFTMFLNGSMQLYLGLTATRVYIQMNIDHLKIKWDNKIRQQIILLRMIDHVIFNEWNFELKLSDGQLKKFNCSNLKYKQVKDVKAFLEENISDKIKGG